MKTILCSASKFKALNVVHFGAVLAIQKYTLSREMRNKNMFVLNVCTTGISCCCFDHVYFICGTIMLRDHILQRLG